MTDASSSRERAKAKVERHRVHQQLKKEKALGVALKGVAEIVPILETVFVLACHYAVSKLCKGMSHHNEVRHVSARLHIHRFRPWAPVRLPGVCFLTNACGSPIAHFERFCSPAGWNLRQARFRASRRVMT